MHQKLRFALSTALLCMFCPQQSLVQQVRYEWMSWLILIFKYLTNQAETTKMLMHSVGFQKTYINTPLEHSSQVSMQYLEESKHSQKMKSLGSVQLIQVKLPRKYIHPNFIITTYKKLKSTMNRINIITSRKWKTSYKAEYNYHSVKNKENPN